MPTTHRLAQRNKQMSSVSANQTSYTNLRIHKDGQRALVVLVSSHLISAYKQLLRVFLAKTRANQSTTTTTQVEKVRDEFIDLHYTQFELMTDDGSSQIDELNAA